MAIKPRDPAPYENFAEAIPRGARRAAFGTLTGRRGIDMSAKPEAILIGKMSLAEALTGRTSVREFAATAVDRQTLQALLEAAVHAPTAMHQEAWGFAVVQDRALLKRISDLAKPLFLDEMHRAHRDRAGRAPAFADPDFDIFHGAGTLVVICGDQAAPYITADCWLAAENLMLAAHALGLGSCVIGSAVAALNAPEIRRELDLADGLQAIAPIVVGYPARRPEPTARKAPLILHWK